MCLPGICPGIDPERPLPLFRSESDDEIGRLGESYNLLGAHIQLLKEEIIRGEALQKRGRSSSASGAD
ncbi:hypothetical protein Q0F98_30355 [Paenibacillus amylolyticus]|nr:hypothetical protein Q0F98_30355 [Paenibacillus amylolyticus]